MSNLKELVVKKQKELSNEIDFLQGREKGKLSDFIGKVGTIVNFQFVKGKNDKEYAKFIVKENDKLYYNGCKSIDEMLKFIEEENMKEDLNSVGLPFTAHGKIELKNGNNFTKVTFYPNVENAVDITDDSVPF